MYKWEKVELKDIIKEQFTENYYVDVTNRVVLVEDSSEEGKLEYQNVSLESILKVYCKKNITEEEYIMYYIDSEKGIVLFKFPQE